jgi:excisionase family DNA binding protein
MIPMTNSLQMMTPKAVAAILGVHQKTVHIWLRNGKLKGVKISYRAWRIPRSALDQFIEQNSNVMPQRGMVEEQGAGITSSLSSNAISNPTTDIHDSPQTKMKHYIRDIMGEQPPEKNPNK